MRTALKERLLTWALLPLLVLTSIWLSTPLIEHNSGRDSDGVLYAAMAESKVADSAFSSTAPWCWRPLTPLLASLLPFSTIMDFKVLAFFSNWLSLILIYEILRRSNLSSVVAAIGVLFYAGIFWTVKFSFYSPCYVDAETQVFLLAVMLLMILRRHWALPLLIGVGALQKESLVLLAPIAFLDYARLHRGPRWSALLYLIALVILGIAGLAGARLAVDPVNQYSSLGTFLANVGRAAQIGFWPRLLLAAFSGLGMLPLVVCSRAGYSYRFLRESPQWLGMILVGILLLFGGVDKARLFLYVLPVVVLTASRIFEDYLRRPSRLVWAWMGSTLLLHLYIGHQLTPMTTYKEYLNWMVPTHAPGSLWPGFARLGLAAFIWLGATLAMVSANALAERQSCRRV